MRKCKNEATTLAFKYWNTPKWKAHFKSQITRAQQLCNQYGEIPVIRAVQKNSWVYSIRLKNFEEKIKTEAKIYEEELKNRIVPEIHIVEDDKTMPSVPKKPNLFGEI